MDDMSFHRRLGRSIATRIPSGSVDVLTNQLGVTSSVGMRLADKFDAVRIIYINLAATATVGMTCAVSVAADLSSPNNSAGTWVTGVMPNAAARASATEPSINFSDWINIAGDNAILYARLYIPTTGNTESSLATFYSDGQTTGAAWATMSGDEYICVKFVGDGITTPSSFNATSTNAFSAIAGVQYRARGEVYTVMGLGDSIMYGTKTLASGDAYWAKAIRALKVAGVKIESANLGRGGQKTSEYYPRAANALAAIKPSALVYGAFSPNDNSGAAPTAASILAQRIYLSTIRDDCRTYDTQLIPVTGMPKGSGTYNVSAYTAAADAFRKSLNDTIRALPVYIDLDKIVSSSIDSAAASGFINNIYPHSDLIHLTEAGNSAVMDEAKRAIKNALYV